MAQECAERARLSQKLADAINAVYALRDQENDGVRKNDVSLAVQLNQARTAHRVAERALRDMAEHGCMAEKN
jgi:cob(I)alamin adenosyltransferase